MTDETGSGLVTAEGIRRVAVLGAGTMGHGIAHVVALAGCEVALYDVDDAAIARGLAKLAENLAAGVTRGKLDATAATAARERVTGAKTIAAACADADVVIEAVPERLELKREVFAAVSAAAPRRALLASNTSSLSIGAIASAVAEPARLVGMHFFNPVHIMKLVEIVRPERASDAAVEVARGFAVRIGKHPIVARDTAGFASSRLGVLLGLEAIRMVAGGVASAADVDAAMKLGYGHPMGPLELTDHVGLDVRLAIAEYLHRELGAAFEPPALLRQLVAEGKLGKKTGQGFYVWREGKPV